MSPKNLQEVLDGAARTVELPRNSQLGACVHPVAAPEFTNWRSEARLIWGEPDREVLLP